MKLQILLTSFVLSLALIICAASPLQAEDKTDNSNTFFVKLPVEQYNSLIDAARDPDRRGDAPVGYALSNAKITVNAEQNKKDKDRITAQVYADLNIEVLNKRWTLVPIVPAGTAVSQATVGGKAAELISSSQGLSWGVKEPGSYVMSLVYNIDGRRTDGGYSLSIPLPSAAATTLNASIPGVDLSPVVIPSAGTKVTESGGLTNISATIPSSNGVQLSWNATSAEGHTISRAKYQGELKEHEDAVTFTGTLTVEAFDNEAFLLKLLPRTATLSDVRVDGKQASISVEGSDFVTRLKGKGTHTVAMDFQATVDKSSGSPSVNLKLPKIPISQFDVTLPGKKEIIVEPATNVVRKDRDGKSTSTFHVPITNRVTFSWNEAVPDEIKEEVRANAELYHLLHAEEGVLYAKAYLSYEVTRGETNILKFAVPKEVQINRVNSTSSASIADWRVDTNKEGSTNNVTVFLNRKVEGTIPLEIDYDLSIIGKKATESFNIPLLRADSVHRQRGMIALLSSKELTLKPLDEKKLTRVGENQLPANIRQGIKKTIAHTYKYVEDSPILVVRATVPEKKQGKFDAVVNTLVSLTDVSLKGSASLEMNVKSGAIEELLLSIPADVNILSLTGPSIRTHEVKTVDGKQEIDVQFTQEMEGQFRLEISYEKITADSLADLQVPTLGVAGAEVEQGKIAVEALSAVEVEASSAKQLSTLEANELPQQLVLKTTNPILLAYKYVHTDPPYELKLKLTRHKVIDVKSASISGAHYHTMVTEDGLAVTAAKFTVKNSRQQFLKVQLPIGSNVWSAYVNGKPEKPALAESKKKDSNEGPSVLIKIINSTQGFPVTLIYQTPVNKLENIGFLQSTLPRPEMVASYTRWDIFVPDNLSYGEPDTNMKVVTKGRRISGGAMEQSVAKSVGTSAGTDSGTFMLSVPASGLLFSLEKRYANLSDEQAFVSLPYAQGVAIMFPILLVILGAMAVCRGVWIGATKKDSKNAFISIVGGAAVLYFMITHIGVDYRPAVAVAGLFVASLIAQVAKKKIDQRRIEA